MHELVIILDFGSQVTQLIARRVREAGVYCEIFPCTISADDTEIIRVTFSNFANLDSLGLTNAIYGLVNGTALTIPEQTLLDRSYEGTGSIDELTGILTLSYTIRDTTGAKALINSCVAVYTP